MITTVSLTIKSFLMPYATHFLARGWKVDALTNGISSDGKAQKTFDSCFEIAWGRNPLKLKNFLSFPKDVQNIVVENHYDLIHVHTPVAAFITRYALRKTKNSAKLRIIYTAHGFHFNSCSNPLRSWVFLLVEKMAGNWTDYLIVINKEDKVAAEKYKLLPPERIVYMPGIGVDLNYYRVSNLSANSRLDVLRELGLTSNDYLFLVIAEFIPRKRHKDILLALSKLDQPSVHVAFAGDGPLIEAMKQLSVSLGLENNVHFLGYRDDIPTLISASVATVLISEQEGLPRSVMESIALETPVIGTDIRGTRDLLEDQRGLLVKVGDINGICQAMNWLINNPLEVQEMAARAKSHIINYDLKNVIRLHEELYERALLEE